MENCRARMDREKEADAKSLQGSIICSVGTPRSLCVKHGTQGESHSEAGSNGHCILQSSVFRKF